ncbi:MAG TPA: RHS repeat-associated core domain-containing protein [Verrucomicrobiae bacterium]|nr:RHS repeat-associated core domain-containing protein [Verrucomicrobiae bacterium]
MPIGAQPSQEENVALAAALVGYSQRSGSDDFTSLTGFLASHPKSVWAAALLTDLGVEYYNTAHYSLALDAWTQAWPLAKEAKNAREAAIANRAVGELAFMYSRLGRMTELEALLKSVDGRLVGGPGTEKLRGARDGLWTMQHRPEVAFRCGPLALRQIKLAVDPKHPADAEIIKSASTQKGFSLPQVAELSKKIGLNYQMAFREKTGAFVAPSVVHWKVGHYAALVRQAGDRYLVQDATFRNDVWATKGALEDETSGYFLIPPGALPPGWRAVDAHEGETVWGKGTTSANDPGPITPRDPKIGPPPCAGMMVRNVHLMDVNLSLVDQPLGYTPPVGPPVHFTVRYNSHEAFQPANFNYGNLSSKWTCDWISYINDNPSNTLADVNYYVSGGGDRTFTGFNTNTRTFAYQLYDQTLLTRTGPSSYQMVWPDGSQLIFSQSDGAVGTSRNIFLTQVVDPQGNALTLTYDSDLRIVSVTDAIGQVTTLNYGLAANTNYGLRADMYKLASVTDPFGRTATLNYIPVLAGYNIIQDPPYQPIKAPFYAWGLGSVTDVAGMVSQVVYGDPLLALQNVDVILLDDLVTSLTTPYGTENYSQGGTNTTLFLETSFPDGSRDRVEFNQTYNIIPDTYPQNIVPLGMNTFDGFLSSRNTFYWSRNACAMAYGDYSKARVYHWQHEGDTVTCSGIIESTKEALEGRVWRDYAGQTTSIFVGTINRPWHVGRVMDDGTTQLYTYHYNGFGHVTNRVDPAGRNFSYDYDSNGIDLLRERQTRATNNELIYGATYNSQHRILTQCGPSGQTNFYTYNNRGQVLSITDARGETLNFAYDTNGYLQTIDGPLPGTGDTASLTYDAFGRIRTLTDVNGYTLTFDYDNLNRVTRITHPDSTFEQFTYDRLDRTVVQDRAGRQTILAYDSLRQLVKKTDPLGRVTLFDWCRCGGLKSLTDSMGRKTTWFTDVQGRPAGKEYGDGSRIAYIYENTTSRLEQVTDDKQQGIRYAYNADDTLSALMYFNSLSPTSDVSYTYDPDYRRIASMSDGIGTTFYSYNPVTDTPTLGAGELASVTGPLTNAVTTYSYDELGRPIHCNINGADWATTYDPAGRVASESNALGTFTYAYDGNSMRPAAETLPNGLNESLAYGNNLEDSALREISYVAGTTPVAQFIYDQDVTRNQITSWSQQAGTQTPSIFNFSYDAANQLLSANVTNAGSLINQFSYSYDPAGNRLTENTGSANYAASYNTLNQISVSSASEGPRTNEWDGVGRLVAVNAGKQRTEFAYDGLSRVTGIRQLVNGAEVSHRLLLWNGGRIAEEHDTNGAVTKRFFPQGVEFMTGTNAGSYYYCKDHLESVRELTDGAGAVRASYSYDPFGRRTKVSGDLDADFGFAEMFWAPEAGLSFTRYRAYDPQYGRWLSRDPLRRAETREGPNLYAYVQNNPVSRMDPEGLGFTTLDAWCEQHPVECAQLGAALGGGAVAAANELEEAEPTIVTAAEDAVTCAQNVVSSGQTIPGVGPDTVNVLANTGRALSNPTLVDILPAGAQVTPEIADAASEIIDADPYAELDQNVLDYLDDPRSLLQRSLDWWQETMQATQEYRDSIMSTGENRKFISDLANFSVDLFGGN